jgi:hypothetical protein
LWFDATYYGKNTNNHLLAPAYLVKPTAFYKGWVYHSTGTINQWGYRFGRYSGRSLGMDFSFRHNYFNHADGVNVVYEDGGVKWIPNVPRKAVLEYGSYEVWPHNEIMMWVLYKLCRPGAVPIVSAWGGKCGKWAE